MCLVEVIIELKAKKKKIFECLLGHCCFHKYGTPPEGPGRLALGHVAPQSWRGFSSQGWVTWGWLAVRNQDTCSLWVQMPLKRLLLPPEGDFREATSNLVLRGSLGVSWTGVCLRREQRNQGKRCCLGFCREEGQVAGQSTGWRPHKPQLRWLQLLVSQEKPPPFL